jgi:pre-mRNA-splicing helicase BRR2
MAEQYAKQSQYQYAANSNLVLDQDRSRIPRRDNEPTGEPETLAGRINPKEMGTRVQREKLPVTEEKKRRAQEKRDIEQARRRNRKEET